MMSLILLDCCKDNPAIPMLFALGFGGVLAIRYGVKQLEHWWFWYPIRKTARKADRANRRKQ